MDHYQEEHYPVSLIIVGALVLLATGLTGAAEYFVAPDGKDANQGTEESPWSLAKANASVKAGDAVILLDGTYTATPIHPANSGEKGKWIVYGAANPRKAVFSKVRVVPGPRPDDDSDQPAAIFLMNRSYITIDRIKVMDPGGRFVYADAAHHITIQGCHFENSRFPGAWESCKFRRVGDYIHLKNNFIKNGNDSVAITGGNYHLIEDNTFYRASHTCLVFMGVQRSVVRRNKIENPYQKLMEVFTTRVGKKWWTDGPERKSMYNVIEKNIFGPAAHENPRYSGSWGIQYAGNKIILRNNIFWKSGGGWSCCGYGETEAAHNRSNRFYNNVVYGCGEQGMYASGPGIGLGGGIEDWGDQVVINNIIFRNRNYPDAHWAQDVSRNIQITIGANAVSEVQFFFNNIIGRNPGDEVFSLGKEKGNGITLKEYEAIYPQKAYGNIEADPLFVDPENGDFRLKERSPCIDRGGPLTLTRSAGQGRDIEVNDALYFCDGYGIIEPDVIRLGNHRVTIERVNYDTNTITVSKDISWDKEALVFLDYKGNAPDMGAFEFEEKK